MTRRKKRRQEKKSAARQAPVSRWPLRWRKLASLVDGRVYVIVAICLASFAFMLPTLIESNWELLDDGVVLGGSQHINSTGTLKVLNDDFQRGRFRPLYHLYLAALYRFLEKNVTLYFIAQAAILGACNLLIWIIVGRLAGRRRVGLFAVGLFMTTSAVVEPFYTLSKSEPTFVLLLAVGVFCVMKAFRIAEERPLQDKVSLWWLAASAGSFLLADLTKETGVMMLAAVPLLIGWVVLRWRVPDQQSVGGRLPLALLLLSVFPVLVFASGRYLFKPAELPSSGSTPYSPGLYLFLDRILIPAQYSLDVYLLAFLLCVALVALAIRWRALDDRVLLACFCGVNGLAHITFQTFFFRSFQVYYLLPAALWIILGLVPALYWLLGNLNSPKRRRVGFAISFSILLLSRLYSIPTVWNLAVGLNAWNEVNGEALQWVRSLPPNPLIYTNGTPEYLVELPLLSRILFGRSDIKCAGIPTGLDALIFTADRPVYFLLTGDDPVNWKVHARALAVTGPSDEEQLRRSTGVDWPLTPDFTAVRQGPVFVPFSRGLSTFRLFWNGYRLNHVENPLLVSIQNPNGCDDPDHSCRQFFFMGKGETELRIFSDRDQSVRISTEIVSGPSLPDVQSPRVMVRTDEGFRQEMIVRRGEFSWAIPLLAGSNSVFMQVMERASRPVLPSGETRPLLLGLRGLQIEKQAANKQGLAELVRIDSPLGCDDPDHRCRQFFWLGNRETTLLVRSDRAQSLSVSADFAPGPALPGVRERHLLVRSSLSPLQRVTVGEGPKTFRVRIAPGLNEIGMRVEERPSVSRLANGDTRPVLLAVGNLRLQAPATAQSPRVIGGANVGSGQASRPGSIE